MDESAWNSLEIVKLVVAALTPLLLLGLGFLGNQRLKRLEARQWWNQTLITKRIRIYDDVAPDLNNLLCFFTYVGGWKEMQPPDVVGAKRSLDRRMYIAAPFFSSHLFGAYQRFIDSCYKPYTGWGHDAQLRTSPELRSAALGDDWNADWGRLFAAEEFRSDPQQVRDAYQRLMASFSEHLGVGGARRPAMADPMPHGASQQFWLDFA